MKRKTTSYLIRSVPGVVLLILMVLQVNGIYAQGIPVSGTITSDDSNEGLPGVNVIVKGTSLGTVTDLNGNYNIDVPDQESVLVFSSVGYVREEVIVGSRTVIDLVLAVDIQALEEIVVVGYGTQKKRQVTGAMSAANVEDIQKLPGTHVGNMLQGQVLGVNVSPGSGAPGEDPVIFVRGLGTINGNTPLYVIDGIPGDIATVNPYDIESINVLKDASAATIYGSRAANGVIIITTKRGKAGKPVVTLNSYVGFKSAAKKLDVLNSADLQKVSAAAYEADGETPLAFTQDPVVYDTDWQDETFRTGIEQKYDLSIAGGNDYINYSLSGGYFNEEGIVIGTGFERYSLRMNADYKLGKRVRLAQTIGYSKFNFDQMDGLETSANKDDPPSSNAGISTILDILGTIPLNPFRDPDEPDGFGKPLYGSGNFIGRHLLTTDRKENDRLQANLSLEIDLVKGLKFRTQFGVNNDNLFTIYHVPTYDFGPQSINDRADLSETRARLTETVWNNVLDYSQTFGEDHSVSAIAGVSFEKQLYRSTGGSNNEMPSNALFALNAGIGDANSWGRNVTSTIQSVFGRANYEFQDKYLIQGSIRRDGSSKFGPENKYGTFWSFSAGWRINNEAFFNVPFISELKPRFSLGTLGNQNIGDYKYLATVQSGGASINYPLGTDDTQPVQIGSISTELAVEDIKWEESKTMNIGLDMGLMEDRFGVTFEYFITETSDMLVETPIPATTGITQNLPFTNLAEMENKGWELGLTYRKKEGEFQFEITGNLFHSSNKITKLGFKDEAWVDGFILFETHPTTRTEVGGEVGRFHLFKTDGLFQSEAEVNAHTGEGGSLLQPNARPGDIRFVDTNNDGVLNDEDKTFFHSGLPDLEYGLTFNAQYKQFDFSLFFQGTSGNMMYNGSRFYLYRRQNDIKNFSAELKNAWTPSNTGTTVPRVSMRDANQNITRPSDYFLEDASYLRLKNIQIGYSFNNLANSGTKLRLYLSGQNLLTITGYKGYDPGLSNFSLFARGVDRGLYPLSRNAMLGLQLTF
ncbi:MAG: TonB-dependent receptor [Cytophagales bacterium]|nr:TonB-dependent receptor [Cytophagales bacterium]